MTAYLYMILRQPEEETRRLTFKSNDFAALHNTVLFPSQRAGRTVSQFVHSLPFFWDLYCN